MSRQITITRTELGLGPLNLQDPANGFYVSDKWKPGAIKWQRFEAAGSAWVDGERVVGQRKIGVDEIFTIYVYASTPAGIKAKVQTVLDAISQYRYTLTINWDGDSHVFQANGAGELKYEGDDIDPTLHAAGWQPIELTIPRDPGLG